MAWILNSDVRAYVGITNDKDDDLLDDLIARAQSIIEGRVTRVFEASADSTRCYDAVRDVDGAALVLDKDLAQITSITNGDGALITSVQYVTEPRNETPIRRIRLLASTGLYWTYVTNPENAIAIVGKWAASITPPADIVHACLRLTAWLYYQRDTLSEGDRPQLSQSGMYLMPPKLPADVETILARYRNIL